VTPERDSNLLALGGNSSSVCMSGGVDEAGSRAAFISHCQFQRLHTSMEVLLLLKRRVTDGRIPATQAYLATWEVQCSRSRAPV
jgi:hypothetical protein